jgi:hypothetical protein
MSLEKILETKRTAHTQFEFTRYVHRRICHFFPFECDDVNEPIQNVFLPLKINKPKTPTLSFSFSRNFIPNKFHYGCLTVDLFQFDFLFTTKRQTTRIN